MNFLKTKGNLSVLLILLFISACRNTNQTKENGEATSQSVGNTQKTDGCKILMFDENSENKETAFKLVFEGSKVLISREGNGEKPYWTKNLTFKDGKILSEDGRTDWLELKKNSLRSFDGEEESFYPFNRSKSTHDIEEIMNPTTSNNNSTQENSNKFSLGDIRGQIIEGSKQEMIRIYGEPDEEYYAHDFLKKYFDFEPFSVYSAEFNIGQTVFIYRNIETNNKPILVLYYESKIISVKYLSDIKSYKDLSR